MFTKQNIKDFRTDFQSAVKELEKKYNCSIKLGSISYTENEFHTRMTVETKTVTTKSGETVDKAKADFEKYCELYGLKKEDYGKTFKDGNIMLTISGIKTTARKNNIILKGNNGKQYVCDSAYVNFRLGIMKGK